jgi:segregation and condensation protein B
MLKLDRPNRLGRASLETLAIIAYRQPVTKSEVEEIRGVDVSANIKTLLDLQLIRLVGKSELPGHPFLYGTTPVFLEHFGLESLQQLNELDPTLQRSNPRLKAATYKKRDNSEPELPLDGEKPQAETPVEEKEESPEEKEESHEEPVDDLEEEPIDETEEDPEEIEDEFDEEDDEDEEDEEEEDDE